MYEYVLTWEALPTYLDNYGDWVLDTPQGDRWEPITVSVSNGYAYTLWRRERGGAEETK